MADDDLWGFGEEPDFRDSSEDEGKQARDASESPDYMLPESKRRKLKQLGAGADGGRRGGRRGGSAAQQQQRVGNGVVDLASDDDSDKQLLREAGARVAGRRSTAASLPEPPRAAARRAARPPAAVDPRTAAMMAQVREVQQRVAQAQAESSSDEESEPLEPSPLVLRATGLPPPLPRQRQQQRQQQQGGEVDLTGGSSGGGPPAASEPADSPRGGGGYAPPAAAEPERVHVKFRSSKGEKVIGLARDAPFSRAFDAYSKWAAEQGHVAAADAPMRFVFDGDVVQGGQTAEDLDLEGDECIDVHY